MKIIKSISLVSLMFILASCATILSKSTQEVTVDSTPQGAAIMLNGAQIGVTPATLTISKKDQGPMILQLEGYIEKEVPLQRKVNPIFFGNIILGGLAGSATDSISGAIKEYNPGQYHVQLDSK